VLKTGGASKVASVPPPKPARKGDVASFESPTGSPATKAGARPTVAAKAVPSAAKRLPVTAAAAAAEEEDDEADEDEDEDEDDVAARAPKVPVSTVIPSTKAFGAGAKGFPTASAKPAAAPAAPAAESDEDDDDDDDDDLPPPSKAAKPAKTGAGLQALARDGWRCARCGAAGDLGRRLTLTWPRPCAVAACRRQGERRGRTGQGRHRRRGRPGQDWYEPRPARARRGCH